MDVVLDPDQVRAEAALRRLGADLRRRPSRGRPWARRLRPRGVYLWGRPGRGKTWLTDRLLRDLRDVPTQRVHFHEFLADPQLAAGIRLLCFDEFHVHDVGDTMFLRRLLGELAARGVTLVATSNYAPEDLLPNPLYHHHVIPSVAEIRASMEVVRVDGPVDYRRLGERTGSASGFASGRYVAPGTLERLELSGVRPPAGGSRDLAVHGRKLRALAVDDGAAWFDFADLCVAPVSVSDYLTLSERISTWVVVGVPHLDETTPQAPQRLANLVDVLHDRDLPFHLACDVGLDELTRADRQPLDPGRMYSRLRLLRPG